MKPEFLRLTKCPYCGTDFSVKNIYEKKGGELITGSVRCECREFAVIEGILNLKVGPVNNYLIRFLKEGKIKEAVGLLLGEYTKDICRILTFLDSKGICGKALEKILSSLMKNNAKCVYRRYSDRKLTFFKLLSKSSFETYLKHRFSAETFWSVYSFIPILKQERQRILDLGCGAGHTSFVISSYVEPQQLICADSIFSNLYLTKKYFAEDAQFICLDANQPLPFKEGTFSSVLLLDVFHYVHSRALLAEEIERILIPQGVLLLLHLHNSLSYNPAAGNPLSPLSWGDLFQQLPIKVLPERNLVEDFIVRGTLDLAKEYNEAELNSSNALIIIGTRTTSFLRAYHELWNDLLDNKNNLIINPIYMVEHKQGKVIFWRKFPSESFRKEYPLTEEYLPERYVISGNLAKAVKGKILDITSAQFSGKDLLDIEDLMRRFIVINVPQDYY